MKDEHKANERQVMDSEESFNTSTDSDKDCVFLFDSELNCIEISKAVLQLFPGGTRKKDVIGKHLLDISLGLKETGRYNKYVEVLKTGIPISEAINVPGPKFADISLSAHIYPVNDGLGIAVNFAAGIGDLEQVAKEIGEAEGRYRGLVEGINDVVYVLDDKAVVTYISPIVESIVGYSASEMVGRNVSEYIYPEDLLLVIEQFQSGSFPNIPGPFEFRLLTRSGEVRWVRNMPRTLFRKNRLIGYQGVLNDITDSKWAVEDLKRKEQQFRALIENASDAIVIVNPDATIRYESPSMARITGRAVGDRIGANPLDYCHPDDILMIMGAFVQLLEKKIAVAQVELRFLHIDGQWLTFEVIGTNLIDEPAVAGIVLNLRDISERKQTEKEFQKSEEQYRTLVETMSDGLSTIDTKGVITYANKRLCDMVGYSRDELVGHPIFNLMDKATKNQFKKEMVKRREGMSSPYEMNLLKKDGSRLVVLVSPQVLKDAKGNIMGSFGVITDVTKEREAEEALQRSEQNLKLAQQIAHMGYWEWDTSTNEVILSEEMRRILGYDQETAIFSGSPKIIHPDDMVKLQEAIAETQKGGNPYIEFRLILPTGDTKWIQAGSTNIDRDEDGTGRLFGYALDITERKHLEEELRYSEQKIRNLFESVGDGLCVIDLNGIYTEVNDKLLEMQGFSSREEIMGKNAFDFVAPRDIDRARVDTQRHLEQGSIELQEYTNIRTDGSEYPVEISSTLLNDASGNPTGFIASVRDVTERKQAEEALLKSQEKLRTVFDSIGEGITVLDLAGTIVDVNETVLRIKGYNREDVIGSFGLDFIPEKDRARATEEMMVLFSGEVDRTPFMEYVLLAKDGSEIPCEASASLLRDGAGNVVGLISVERDLRERKKVENILRESEEHYRMLLETSPHGIQENDISGLITFSNRAHHGIMGCAEGEINGKYIWDLLATNHEKEELQAYFARLVSEKPLPVPYFTRNGTKDGRIVDVQVDWNYRYDAQGQLVGFVSIITDITDRKRSEQMLKESEELLKRAEKLAGIGSWQWNLRSNAFILSEGMCLLYGTEGQEFAHFKDIVETSVHPDDREAVYKAAEVVTVKGSEKTLIYRIIRPDGEVRWINATVPEVRRFSEDGKPEIMFGAVQDITERKKAAQELRDREERWRLFSESATDVFTIWDSKLNLIDNSEKGIQTFFAPGTRKDDIVGKNMMEFIPEEEKIGRYHDYLNVIKTGKPYFSDNTVPHHKFGDRYVSIKAFKVGEGLGTIVTDITEQKKAEHQIKESGERLRAFMDSSTDIYTIWDSQLRLVDVSDKGVKAFLPDKTREEQIGKHISEIVPEVMETGRYEEYLKVIQTGEPFQVHEAIVHPRFTVRHISIKAFKVQDGMGQVVTDITQRVEAERKLKENEERLRSFMESATDTFNIWDSNLDLVYTPEKGIKEYFPPGTKKEDILGKNLLEIVPDLKNTNRYDEYLKVIETGEPFFAEDVIPSAMFGHRHISIKAFKSGNDMGQVITDTTRQKQADEQLRSYAERIRAMAKQLSEVEESQRRTIARELHDNVGQNLTVLGINFSRAKTQMDKAKIEEVQSILDDSQHLLEQTTESIRNVMADLRPPVLEEYGLLAALRWYGNLFSLRNQISTTVQGEEPAPRLGIDVEIVLFRIAQEALTNIAKHAKASNVTMNFDIKDGRQRLVITDDGVGFDTGELSKYKEQTSWGLVTMSERAQSIGGSLSIESHPGGGTKIVVEVTK